MYLVKQSRLLLKRQSDGKTAGGRKAWQTGHRPCRCLFVIETTQTAHSAPRSYPQISALCLTVNMSKRQIKAQASSSRVASGAFGSGFGSTSTSAFGATSSPLSYVTEPPDLSSISDPNIIVAFKNLSKKDGTTKAKALEDMQTYVSSLSGQVEEAVLEAWVGLLLGCTYLANGNFGFLSDQDLSSYIHR